MAAIRGMAFLTDKEVAKLEAEGVFELSSLVATTPDGVSRDTHIPVQGGVLVPRFAMRGVVVAGRDRSVPPGKSLPFHGELRPYQEVPVANAIRRLKAKRGLILEAACGTGKTVMALAISARIGVDTIILVDQVDIAEQWRDRIQEFIPSASVVIMGGGHMSVRKDIAADYRIIVAQSLWRKAWHEDPLICSTLIVDEVHVFSAPKFCASIANINFRYSLGLSATPDRKDKLEWIFQAMIGTESEVVEGKVLTASIVQVRGPRLAPNVDAKDYNQAWCQRVRGLTHMAKCRKCPQFWNFPCELKVDPGGNPVWNPRKTAFTNLVQDACITEEMHAVADFYVRQLYDMGRNITVFSQFKAVLEKAYFRGVAAFGEKNCGVFIGKSGKRDKQRGTALDKRVTYLTYGVAAKALDVPHKDSAVLLTPVSDIRQIKGRIERTRPGKPQPVVIDIVHEHIPQFVGMAAKRARQYRESNNPVQVIRI